MPYQELLGPRSLDDVDLLVIHCTELPDLAMAREYGERILYPAPAAGRGDAATATSLEASPASPPGKGEGPGTGNSGHFYIDRDGSIEQWVDTRRIAHHVRGYNPRSVGVELVNLGRYPDWFHSARQQMTEAYPDAQIRALLRLIRQLQSTLPNLRWIAGHAELDTGLMAAEDDAANLIRRKLDPGPLFPWKQLLADSGLERLGG